jgi:hypothetical protein
MKTLKQLQTLYQTFNRELELMYTNNRKRIRMTFTEFVEDFDKDKSLEVNTNMCDLVVRESRNTGYGFNRSKILQLELDEMSINGKIDHPLFQEMLNQGIFQKAISMNTKNNEDYETLKSMTDKHLGLFEDSLNGFISNMVNKIINGKGIQKLNEKEYILFVYDDNTSHYIDSIEIVKINSTTAHVKLYAYSNTETFEFKRFKLEKLQLSLQRMLLKHWEKFYNETTELIEN